MAVEKILSLFMALVIFFAARAYPHRVLQEIIALSTSQMAAPLPQPPIASSPLPSPSPLSSPSLPPQMAASPPQFPPSPPPLPSPAPISSPSPMSMPPQLPIAFPPSPPPLPTPAPISSPSPMSMPPQLPIALPPSPPPLPSAGIKGAYWPSSSALPPSAIPTSYFTHLFYAFVQVDATSFQILITPPDESLMADFTATAHAAKALLSIAADSQTFSNMSSSPDKRAAFIESSIRTARCYNFDGLDLDWEYPADPQQMANLASLFAEWRAAINLESLASARPPLLLSCAVYFASSFLPGNVPRNYPGEAIRQHVDFVSPMCYDYDGAWHPNFTGAQALLYDKSSNVSTSYGISTWKGDGVPPEKIVMGMPAYGRAWQLKDPNQHGIGAPAAGIWQEATQGVMNYSAIVEFNRENNATVVFDNATVSAYAYAGTDWIGYDDVTTVEYKVNFAKAQGLGGYFFWALGFDSDWELARAASAAWDIGN